MVSIAAPKPLFSEASVPSDIGPDLLYIPDFLTPEEATRLYNTLLKEIPWKQFTGSFGKPVPGWNRGTGMLMPCTAATTGA
jgi:hypothetical protein